MAYVGTFLLGSTRLSVSGKRPSRAIAKYTRGPAMDMAVIELMIAVPISKLSKTLPQGPKETLATTSATAIFPLNSATGTALK